VKLSDGETKPLDGLVGESCEISMEITPSAAGLCGLKVRASTDGQEETLLYFDATNKDLVFDSTHSGQEGRKVVESAPLVLEKRELLKLRVFVDKSVVEIFANDRQAIGRRVYPALPDSQGVVLFSMGGAARFKAVKAWEIMPANPS
jgi:beta-fructofuranosidase